MTSILDPDQIELFKFIAFALVTSFTCTLLLVPLVEKLAHYGNFIDIPSERRIHTRKIARLGGLAVFCGTLVGYSSCAVTSYTHIDPFITWWIPGLLGSSTVVIVGLLDDARSLNAKAKLVGQCTAALIMCIAGIRIRTVFGIELPEFISYAATICWFIFLTNAFNLIDGLDGLASGLAAIAGLGLCGALLQRDLYAEALLCVTLIGSTSAFLIFNRSPASIFLGDCGSNFLGFFFATLTVATGSKGSSLAYFWIPASAFLVPALDTVLAIWRRSSRFALAKILDLPSVGGVMRADLDHLHHRLLKLNLSQREVVHLLYLANALPVLLGLACFPCDFTEIALPAVALIVLGGLVLRRLPMNELWESFILLFHLLARPRSRTLASIAYVAIDLVSLATSAFLAIRLTHPDFPMKLILYSWWTFAPRMLIGTFPLLVLFEVTPYCKFRFPIFKPFVRAGAFLCLPIVLSVVFRQTSSGANHTIAVEAILCLGFTLLILGASRAILALIEIFVFQRLTQTTELPLSAGAARLSFYGRLFIPNTLESIIDINKVTMELLEAIKRELPSIPQAPRANEDSSEKSNPAP